MSRRLPPLPIDDVLPQLAAELARVPSLVLRAPTGAGKTTRVPPFLLDAVLGRDGGQVVLVEPRRLATRAAAVRMAEERGVRLGAEVGYAVRFDRRAGPVTRILVVTEGLFLRRLQRDPFLDGVGAVVFDEFHERSLDLDLAFALTRYVQRDARPDLRLVVLSATLEPEALLRFLEPAAYVASEGRMHPVAVRYAPPLPRERVDDGVLRLVRSLLPAPEGDVLAFLPGVAEIRRVHAALDRTPEARGVDVLPLYGDLDPARQDAVLRPGTRPRIVLATNVAESSLTIPGTRVVVDGLHARIARFDPRTGMNRLQVERISRASAEQRRGRAGRTAPGSCVRWIAEREFDALPAEPEPDVRRVELSGALLQLHAFGERDPRAFPWFERPRDAALDEAQRLLERLGALRGGSLTPLGERLAVLPAEPRLARLLLAGAERGIARQAALAAAMLGERDPFQRETEGPSDGVSDCDLGDRVRALERFERSGETHTAFGRLVPARGRWVLRAAQDLTRLVERAPGATDALPEEGSSATALRRALLAAFPDRVVKRRADDPRRGVLVGGRGVVLARGSLVTEGELFVACDLQGARGEARVHRAARIERAWLAEHLRVERDEAWFDEARERVATRRVLRYEDLVLEERETGDVPAAEVEAVLLAAARRAPDRALARDDEAVRSFLGRLAFLRAAYPERAWPAFDDATWDALLADLVPGRRSFAELRRVALLPWLLARLDPEARRLLEREAPETLTVPSGSRIRLRYEAGRPPVLAVRIQEVFSWTATPRLAEGRVPVLLHLLAPNMRPQQITEDLASFWKNGYPEVRKELRRRYPKHAWPDDPTQAQPVRGTRRRP